MVVRGQTSSRLRTPMSASATTHPTAPTTGRAKSFFTLLAAAILAAAGLVPTPCAAADEFEEAEAALIKLANKYEKEGFEFRADIWERPLPANVGKAVRVQLFKGNEYRVCVVVPPQSGVEIVAHVLDLDGKPFESKVEATEGKWGVTLHVKPKRTGVYAVIVARSGGKEKSTVAAMINGYK